MAKERRIFVSSVVILFLLTPSPTLGAVTKEDDAGEITDPNINSYNEDPQITWKYGLEWTRSSIKAPRYDFSNFNDDIDSVDCTSDLNCTAALPGVEAALDYVSNIPSSPKCVLPDDSQNTTMPSQHDPYKCTCDGKCVSYSRESSTGEPFYYCGPCGHVGSKCHSEDDCTHELGECRGGYCECVQEGKFYDMAYCYIPFYGQEILINILIASSILLLCCATLAYGYHKLGNPDLRRTSFYAERGNSIGRRESPSDDTPPAYDDVIEKLPSYQDAIQMSEKSEEERGQENPAFEDDSGTDTTRADQDSTTAGVNALQTDTEGHNNASTPSYQQDTTIEVESKPQSNEDQSPSQTPNGDIASFPESPLQEDRDSERGLGTQPIELALYDALHTQHNTTSL